MRSYTYTIKSGKLLTFDPHAISQGTKTDYREAIERIATSKMYQAGKCRPSTLERLDHLVRLLGKF